MSDYTLIPTAELAKVREALANALALNYQRHCGYKTTEVTEASMVEGANKALAIIDAAKPVEVVGYEHYPSEKPSLSMLSIQPTPSASQRVRGFITRTCYAIKEPS